MGRGSGVVSLPVANVESQVYLVVFDYLLHIHVSDYASLILPLVFSSDGLFVFLCRPSIQCPFVPITSLASLCPVLIFLIQMSSPYVDSVRMCFVDSLITQAILSPLWSVQLYSSSFSILVLGIVQRFRLLIRFPPSAGFSRVLQTVISIP